MDRGIGMFDPIGITYPDTVPTLMPGVVAYSSSTPVLSNTPTGIPMDATPVPTSSASYLPHPPHIAIPPTPSPSVSEAADNRLDIGAIVGIVLGSLAFVVVTGAVIFYLCRRKRLSDGKKNQGSRGSWIDLESKSIRYDLDSLPYDEVKAPELGASAHYTKYVPRTLGRLSPISQMVPPTFDLIKDHHLSSDLLTDPKTPPARGTRQNASPSYLNDIELTVTPFDTHFAH